jgi:hypothetical protein
MKKRATYLILGVMAALVVVPATAQAQVSSAPTSVTLRYESPNFVGTVSSPNPDCEPGRQVTLFERQVGGGAEAVGGTTTDAGGNFSIPQPGADGQFFVTVSARNLPGGYGQVDSCEGAQSETAPAGSGILGGSDEDDDGDDDGGIAGEDDGDGAGLPFTGSELGAFAALSLALIGAGALLVRRNRSIA